jgi:hypothetical protein
MGFATAALVGLGALQVGTSIASGYAQNKEAKYNASLAEQQAANVENEKGLTAYQYNRQIGQVAGTTTARIAKSGLTMSGSPMAVMLDTYTQMEMDKRIQINNLETQKQQSLSQAQAYKRQGKTALFGGYTNAFTSALQTGVQYGTMSGSFDTKNYANISGMGKVQIAPANYYLGAGKL